MSADNARVHFRSLGCKVNLADAAEVVERLPPGLITLADTPAGADLVVLNTCVVTHKAERDVRKILGGLQRDYPKLPVVVTGCAANLRGDQLSDYPNVRAVVPPGDPQAVARRICACLELDSPTPRDDRSQSAFFRLRRHRAVLKVQDGCNSRCTYCIVPRVRGPERSLPIDQVIRRIEHYTLGGHREMVLSGIHLGRYGAERKSDSLAKLLKALLPVFDRLGPGYRIRLSSIEPLEWSEEMLEIVSEHTFICPHFHIPLQSGDDEVLKRMGRPYRSKQFVGMVKDLHRRLPRAALGTDVLVGFPGESDAAADNTLALIERLPLSYLHVFTFSPRPGTPAHDMSGQVDPQTIRRRAARVRKAGEKLWREFLSRGVGQTHQVLIEKTAPSGFEGHTGGYHPFLVIGSDCQPGQLIEARAEGLQDQTLVGCEAGAS